MQSLLKKLALLIFLCLSLFALSHKQAFAAGEWYDPSFNDFTIKVFDGNPSEVFGERYTYAQVQWILNSLPAAVEGRGVIDCSRPVITGDTGEIAGCLENLRSTGALNSTSGPLLSLAYVGDEILKNKPASGIEYIADTFSKFHLIPEAYAQGLGFQTLTPVQNMWKASRNMAYLFLIVAFIAMAFMIMFRVKISPQAVITVQSALPKVAIALILITFSYAIAGFIIDLSYLVLGIFSLLINSAGGNSISGLNTLELFSKLNNGDPWGTLAISIMLISLIPATVVGVTASIFLTPLGSAAVGGIILLIVLVFLLLVFLKMIWVMIKTLINVLLLVIAGPLMILLGTLPGGITFGTWLKALIANVAVFPLIQILFFLAHFFFWGFFVWNIGDVPLGGLGGTNGEPLLNIYQINAGAVGQQNISLPNFNLGGGLPQGLIGIALAIGTLALIPKAADLIKALIQGQQFAYGAALAEPIGAAAAVGTYPARWVWNLYTASQQKAASESVSSYFGFQDILSRVIKKKG